MRRHPPSVLRPDRVEEALPVEVRGSLYDLCKAFGGDMARWPDHPLLCDLLTLAAAANLRTRKERARHRLGSNVRAHAVPWRYRVTGAPPRSMVGVSETGGTTSVPPVFLAVPIWNRLKRPVH